MSCPYPNSANFDFLVFSDSDGQYNFSDVDALLGEIGKRQVDMIIGRRQRRVEPLYRRIPSRFLAILEKLLFDVNSADVTSAFRVMRVKDAREVASRVRYSPYNFWLEFTARAKMMGLHQREIDVDYRNRAGETKVYLPHEMPRVIWSEFFALLKTRMEADSPK